MFEKTKIERVCLHSQMCHLVARHIAHPATLPNKLQLHSVTYILKSEMLLVVWELVVELLERRTLAHLLQIFHLALRQTTLAQVLVFFFLPR